MIPHPAACCHADVDYSSQGARMKCCHADVDSSYQGARMKEKLEHFFKVCLPAEETRLRSSHLIHAVKGASHGLTPSTRTRTEYLSPGHF